MSGVESCYNGESIFITGATGFIGKVLLEKVLYSCPGVKNVYILIREKKNKQPEKNKDRFEELVENKIFNRIKSSRPKDMEKIIPIWGDLSKTSLGIFEDQEREIIEKVSFVFHCAATVRFNEPLKLAVEINMIGTKNILDFFKKFKKRKAFVHLSTAYSQCQRTHLEERLYPPSIDPEFLLDAHSHLDTETMEFLTNKISEGRPNTYTITKALTENYLNENAQGLPVAIVRPSIVSNAINEPIKGWGESSSILSGISYAVGCGYVHILPLNGDAKLDIIPVDFVSNLIIVVGWLKAIHGSNEIMPVYNIVHGKKNPLKFSKYMGKGVEYIRSNPPIRVASYPTLSFTQNNLYLYLSIYVNHYIPALAMDIYEILKGRKTKYFKNYRRFYATLHLKSFFLESEFNFDFQKVTDLKSLMSSRDQEIFNFDAESIYWPEYLIDIYKGITAFYEPNDNKTNMPKRRKKMKWLYVRYLTTSYCLPLVAFVLGYILVFKQ